MKQFMWGLVGVAIMFCGCGIGKQMIYSGSGDRWERATLLQDEFGSQLKIVRQNEEAWLIEAKTYCFWTMSYVGREVWFQWGPVECKVKSDDGEICEFWTKGKAP